MIRVTVKVDGQIAGNGTAVLVDGATSLMSLINSEGLFAFNHNQGLVTVEVGPPAMPPPPVEEEQQVFGTTPVYKIGLKILKPGDYTIDFTV